MHYSKNKFKKFIDSKSCFILSILTSVYLIILYAPMFLNEGSLITTDQPMWTTFTYLMKREIIPDQKWFWNVITDRENAGLVMGHSYSLNIISLWLLTHVFSPVLSVKIFLFLCALSITVSIYFVSSKLSNPIIGVIPALLSIPVFFLNANEGMCYSYLSFSFALLFWFSSLKFFESLFSKYWILSVLLTTLSIYTHPIGFIACLSIWVSLLLFVVGNKEVKPLNKVAVVYFIIPFISLLLSAPQIFAMFNLSSDQGYHFISTYPGNSLSPTLEKTLNLDTYFPNYIWFKGKFFLFFFWAAGLVSVFKKDNQLKLPLISLYVVLFLLVSKSLMLSPIKPHFFYRLTLYYWRFIPYLRIVCIMFVGMGLHFIYAKIMNFSSKRKMISLVIKFVGIMIIVAALGLCGRTLTKNRRINAHSLITFDQIYSKKEISSLWGWLFRNVDSELYRVYFEDTFSTYPSKNSKYRLNHILALTSSATDIKQIGGWGGFASDFASKYNRGWGGYLFQTNEFNKLSENTIGENLKLLNCKFVVAHSKDLVHFLKSLTIFKQAAVIGSFTIFEYQNMIPAWGFNVKSKEKINLERVSSSSYNIITNGHTGDLIHLSLAYHLNWKAYYKNTEIPINYHDSFMRISLPATGKQVVELRYSIDKVTPVLFLIIGMTVFIFFLFYARNM